MMTPTQKADADRCERFYYAAMDHLVAKAHRALSEGRPHDACEDAGAVRRSVSNVRAGLPDHAALLGPAELARKTALADSYLEEARFVVEEALRDGADGPATRPRC